MPTLLHIDSSPLGAASISRQLSTEFVKSWKLANPAGKVVTRDLSTWPPAAIDAAWIGAAYTPEEARTPAQREILTLSDSLIAELQSADEYVFGVPMHNFSVPAVLKLWIDQIARVGKTFTFADGAAVGLLKNKRATFIIAAGGVYDAGTARAAFDFVEPYLRAFFGFLAVTDTSFVNAGGAAALKYGQIDLQAFLEPHIRSIQAQFQPA